MTPDQASQIVREAVMLTLIISGPILGIGLVVGLVVSLFQAVTQIQEQTLSFVPKILAMAGALILLVPWMGVKLLEFSAQMFSH
jgi:flagellar biosynthetic protein FliQ